MLEVAPVRSDGEGASVTGYAEGATSTAVEPMCVRGDDEVIRGKEVAAEPASSHRDEHDRG